jgi:hypothetical protein
LEGERKKKREEKKGKLVVAVRYKLMGVSKFLKKMNKYE